MSIYLVERQKGVQRETQGRDSQKNILHEGRLVMIINHNISALNTHRQLSANNNAVQGSLEKLSSGLQINRAGDDAAGLAISEKMRGQIRGLDMATKNAQDGISLIQTAEGALNETHSILQRMRELAVQSSNDTNTAEDRAELQKEANQLAEELTRIADNTEFNTQNLLGGDFQATFHIGANENQNLKIDINAMGANALAVEGKLVEEENATIKIGDQEFTDQKVLKNGDSVVAVDVEGEYYLVNDLVAEKDRNLRHTININLHPRIIGRLSYTLYTMACLPLVQPKILHNQGYR